MSYTAVYSPLFPLDEENPRKGVRITDPDALDAWADRYDAQNILDDAEIKERTDHSDYPKQVYDYLLGFRTWKPQEPTGDHDGSTLGAYHNIERLGYFYGGNFTSFWAGLSLATEPFEVYNPAPEHGLRESGRGIIESSTKKGESGERVTTNDAHGVEVAHLRARDGEATVDLLTLGVTDVERGAETVTVEEVKDGE